MLDKKAQLRYNYGALDLVSAGLVLIGIYLVQTGNNKLGWLLIAIGILKQFSYR